MFILIEKYTSISIQKYTMHEHLNLFGLIIMNGRMYDPWTGRFLSPDPVVQKPEYGPNYNPYSYCLNNPLKYIDPSGYNYDWYQNVLTGDMYYNSTYKGESDAEKIDGEGWEYFGPDGMFGLPEILLAREYNLPVKPLNGLGFTVEIPLKGDKAEGFMQEMGYEFVPTQQVIYTKELTVYMFQAKQTYHYGKEIIIDEKSTYLPNNYCYSYSQGIKGHSIKGSDDIKPMWEIVSRVSLKYTDNILLQQPHPILQSKLLNAVITGSNDWDNKKTRHLKSWQEYKGDIELINKFVRIYGKD